MSAFSDFMANLGRIVENPTLGDLPALGGVLRGASPTTAQAPIFPHKQQVDALPLVGGAMNLGSKALVGVPLAAMEAQMQGAHKVNQGADESAGGLTALLVGVAKGGRLKTALRDPNYVMTPDDINTAKAMAALEQGHLMRAQEIFQSGPDSTTAYVAGAGRLVLNPLNFIGAAGAAMKGVRGLDAAGRALQATDQLMALPFTAAGGALRQLPSGVARTLGGATAGAVTGAGYSKLSGDDQGLRDAMLGAGLGAGGVAGSSAFAKYLARNAPELAPAVAADMAPAIAAAERNAPLRDLTSAIPSYDPLPRPARLPEAPNFPRPSGEPLAPLPPRVEPVAPPPGGDLPPPPVVRPEPPTITPAVPEPVATTPAAPANALSVGERGALLDRVTSGEFGPLRTVLDALHNANYGANAAFALKGIYGKATIPADAVRNHLDYLLARTLDDPQRWDALAQRAPQLAQALDTVPLAQVPTDTMQQALRATLGRPLKGKLPKGTIIPTTERPVDEVAADILRATQQGDKSALDGYLNEYRALQQPKPEIATPAAPAADIQPLIAADPAAAYANDLPPVTTAPAAGDTLYQRAVGLLHGGDPQFNSPYVPGPTYFLRRLPIDEATANSIVQRMVKDPAIVEVAPTGDALLRSQMNPKYRGRLAAVLAPSAPDVPLAPVTSAEAVIQPGQYPASDFRSWFYQMPEPTGMTSDTFEQAYSRAKDLVRASGSDTLPYSGTLQQGLGVDSDTAVALFRRLAQDRAVTSGGSNRAREALLAPEFLASRAPVAPAQPATLTPVQQVAADARNRLFGDTAALTDASAPLPQAAPVPDSGISRPGKEANQANLAIANEPVAQTMQRLQELVARLPKPSKATVALPLSDGTQRAVDMQQYGALAIHRALAGKGYTVTHLPSSLALAFVDNIAQAKAVIAAALDTSIPWAAKSPLDGVSLPARFVHDMNAARVYVSPAKAALPGSLESPLALTGKQQELADTWHRVFGDEPPAWLGAARGASDPTNSAAGDLGLNVGAKLTSPLGKRAAAGALAGGLSAYGDPNATPEDVLMRGLVGAGVGASAPMALRGATRLARELVPDAPKAWQELTANVLHDVTRLKESPERVAEFGQEVALAARAAWQKGKAEFGGGDVPLYKAPAAAMKQWRAQIVATLHNLLQDDLTTRGKYILFGKQDGVSLADFTATRASLRRNFNNADAFSKHSDGVQELLASTGQQDYAVGKELGAGVIDESTLGGTYAGPLQRAVVGAGISLANPITGLVPAPSIAYGAARGVMEPFVNNFFHAMNGFVHVAGREGYFVPVAAKKLETAATPFLDDLARQGVDTTALAAKAGQFSANDVEQAVLAAGVLPDAAATLGAQWAEASKGALDQAAARVRTVFGDMNALGGLGRNLSGVAPFASWPISQAKITAELLAKYPGPAAVTAGAIRRNEEQLQARGEPSYYAASIAVPTDLPLVGGLARARLGGEKGTVYLNPASLLVPGTDPLTVSTPKAQDQQKTAYQRAQDLLGLAGLSWGPAVQAAAYATGQDYRRPGPLSRTAGLEAAAPGPSVTAWPVRALDATRKLLVPALSKAGVPTGGSGAPPDPIQKELAALVWARTGKVLGDAGTEQALRDSLDPNSALYQEAMQRVKNKAALGNAVSVTSPFTISANPAMTSELYQARAQTPYDYTALKTMETYAKRAPDATFTPEERQTLLDVARPLVQLPGGMPVEQVPAPLLAAMTLAVMNEVNSNYQERVPASRVLGMTSTKNRTDALIQAWKEKHSGLTQWPAIYKAELDAYKKSLAAP